MASDIGLTAARYGKDKVRVFRIVKGDKWHDIVEYNVCTLLEGNIETSYTQADNSVVVATDSIKNMTYYMAKVSPFVLVPEVFAMHLGSFILGRYAHLHKAFVTVEQLRWQRISVDGKPHSHSFWRDGDEKRITTVEIDGTAGKDKLVAKVSSGVADLLVLKSTGSAFENFVRDEFTTLVEVNDRIFSTSIDMSYVYTPIALGAAKEDDLAKVKDEFSFDKVASRAREITLDIFAIDESASVQATLYKMATQIVSEHAKVLNITYKLPNKHYIPVDMKYINIDNMTPSKAEVFCPVAAPSGFITATIGRK